MSVKFPQMDYPSGSLLRGGSDIWDTPQASVVLADDMFAAAGPAPTVLTANSVAATATSTQGAVGQTNVLTGNSARQDNTSVPGAVTQLHTVAGNSVAQGATSSVGACVQEHLLAGNSARADSSRTAGGVGQSHKLAGSACSATTEGQSAPISQTHALSAASNVYASVAQSGGIDQLHQLSGEPAYQAALSTRIVEYIAPKCTSWLIRPDTHTVNIVMDAMTAVSQQPMMTANMLDGYSIYQKSDTFSVEIRQCYKS